MKTGTIITTMTIAVAMTIATQAAAWMGPGYYCDRHMMYNNATGPMTGPAAGPALTQEQQATVDKITAEYQERLARTETAIREKIAALDRAYADKDTTVAEVTDLRNELYDLRRDYWQTRRELNLKIADALGRRYYGAGGWGPAYCAMDGYTGGPMGPGHMMGWRCW